MRTTFAVALLLSFGCDKKPAPTAAPVPPDFTATAPAPAPAPAPPPPAPESTWTEWTHPKKLITAKFPGKPEQSEDEAATPMGPVKFTMAIHGSQTRGYMVTAVLYELPEGASFDKEKGLDGARDQMLAQIKAKATSEKKVTLDGFGGREILFEAPGPNGATIRGISRVYAGDSPPSCYIASAFRLTEADDPDAVTFLDSVHLTKGE